MFYIVQAKQYTTGAWLRCNYSPTFATKAEASEWLSQRTRYYSHKTSGLYRIVAMDLIPDRKSVV